LYKPKEGECTVDRLTRRQLKQDEFRETFEQFEEYLKKNYQNIVTVVLLVMVVVGAAAGLKFYVDRQEAAADADLAVALKTFHGYVGAPDPANQTPDADTFPTAQAKYKKALDQFNAVVRKYRMFPRPKAVAIARYHLGVCQALLGDSAPAIKTLEEASHDRDREIASLARFALAGELAKAGRSAEGAKIYQDLADHPTLSVPRATALLALADAYRDSQPARARQIYQQVEKEFGSDSTLAATLKQEMATLPQ
jgi:tetratricopeptide (TPR) repeat protein